MKPYGLAIAVGIVAITLGFIVGAVVVHLDGGNNTADIEIVGAVAAVIAPTIASLIALLKSAETSDTVNAIKRDMNGKQDKTP